MRVGSATCEGIVGWNAVALSFVCGSMTEPWGCSERAAVSFEMGVDIVMAELRWLSREASFVARQPLIPRATDHDDAGDVMGCNKRQSDKITGE